MALSRIGKQLIKLESGVTVEEKDSQIIVKGPKGEQVIDLREGFALKVEDGYVSIEMTQEDTRNRLKPFHGLYASLLKNAVIGVSTGFSKTLKLIGVGYKAQLKGKTLVLNVGYSHPIEFEPPAGLEIKAENPTTITISGADKQAVGQLASEIRATRPPEPYKGKGVHYVTNVATGETERVRRKEGKAASKG